MSQVLIRLMAEGDVDGVMEIAAGLATAPDWPRAAYLGAIDSEATPRRLALAAEADDDLAGFAVASFVAGRAELEVIAVAGAAQRRGIGLALLTELAGRLKAMGISELELEVRASNLPAMGLYGQAGFAETGRRRGYYRDPVEDAVLLRRLL
jgi:[ribosomal protein S18]-alanine N-acetyltransferase